MGGLLGGGEGQMLCWPPSKLLGGGGLPPSSCAYGLIREAFRSLC